MQACAQEEGRALGRLGLAGPPRGRGGRGFRGMPRGRGRFDDFEPRRYVPRGGRSYYDDSPPPPSSYRWLPFFARLTGPYGSLYAFLQARAALHVTQHEAYYSIHSCLFMLRTDTKR